MSARDEQNLNQAPCDDLLGNGVRRRDFLKYCAGVFATAALPEAIAACGSPTAGPADALETANLVSFTSVPMKWVTRKQDGLSLGFQFVNIVADANHNIALAPGAAAGSAYVAITFPPQHIVEDALGPGTGFSYSEPLNAYASGTSRLVFSVPATYGTAVDAGGVGTFPYTLQGMLELCAVSSPVVATNAQTNAGTTRFYAIDKPLTREERKFETLSQARIDRVIARVDPEAAERVRRRTARAARILNPELTIIPIHTVHTGTAPVAPTDGQTSIELPFRLLVSPNETMGWSFMANPVASPATTGSDAARTELWHARPGLPDPVSGIADPSLGAIALRALWTRDYDLYGDPLPVLDAGAAVSREPVQNAVPNAANRDAIVANTGNMAGSALPALNASRLLLSPQGGTIGVNARFDASVSQSNLQSWVQNTVLGRDEYVETINIGTVLPFGQPAALVSINKRAEDPTQGTVGVLYSQTYLVISQPLVSYQGVGTPSDYNRFPFVAVELKQTKIPCAAIPAGSPSMVYNPTGGALAVVGATGTDYRGNSITFSTALYFCPDSSVGSTVAAQWNAYGSQAANAYAMKNQRIALAPMADGSDAAASSYSADSTSFPVTSFNVTLTTPSSGATTPYSLVPVATNLQLTVEALAHLQSSPATGTPAATATYNYDTVVYAKNGFDKTANPHELFLTLAGGTTPNLDFTSGGKAAQNSGGLVAPALNANALSRSAGVLSGSTAAGSPLMTGEFQPTDYFAGFLDKIKLFGFVPLGGIIEDVGKGVGDLASKYMPKSVSQTLSNAEAFLQKAVALYNMLDGLVGSSGAGQVTQVLNQVSADMTAFGQLAQGIVPAGGISTGGLSIAGGAPLTNAQMQAAAWLQSGATQAQELITGYVTQLTTFVTDLEAIVNDITSLEFTNLVKSDGTGDLQKAISDILGFIADVKTLTSASNDPQTAAGAVLSYFGPVATVIESAANEVNAFLSPVGNILTQLLQDLGYLAQGLDLARNLSVEFKWKPLISGIECLEALAFIPSTNQALSLDLKVDANSNNGPTGLDMTVRLDSFAICFGQGIPAPTGSTTLGCGTIPAGYSNVVQNADVSLVFDHIQVQMLAGQKPSVDCVFSNLYFGGDLSFIETIKNLIPLDSFSDPPFVNVTTSGITAGFTLAIPNIAIGMFSIQNINIGASLSIPWIADSLKNGVTFEFDFCTIDNPFVVTVSMLGGGGFFGMTLDMTGLRRIQFGVEVCAQLAIDLVVASGSVSIEVGIFLVYTVGPVASGTIDPVSGEPEVVGWLIGGYLRLRGELDVAGIITISVELYLEITYSPSTGKCIASGYIEIDVSLFFFSLHAHVPFSRQFAGSNGDPTFAEMMSPGGVDPMVDPTLLNAAPSAEWDPFAEYCMAYSNL